MDNTKDKVSKIIDKIRTIRKEKGYSNEAMATDLDISTSAYNKMERMEASISLERFIRIREILDVPYSEFFDCTTKNFYIQDLKDRSMGIGNCEIQILNQENQEITKKLMQNYEQQISHLQEEIEFLKKLMKSKD